jgi:hypothetical protein
VHHLVAAYLDYQGPAEEAPDEPDEPAAYAVSPAWLASASSVAGMRGLPPSQAFAEATNRADAVAAAERMFFGEVNEFRR